MNKKYIFTNIDAILIHPAWDNDESLKAKVQNKICKGEG